jgi:hypothetical protein
VSGEYVVRRGVTVASEIEHGKRFILRRVFPATTIQKTITAIKTLALASPEVKALFNAMSE